MLVLITGLYLFFSYVALPYNIRTKGIIYPSKEWRIVKTDDGTLLNVLKNNLNNTISYYSVTEFQRGDIAEFVVNDAVYNKQKINEGDTIGYIKSNEEQRRFIELKGKLAVQNNLLQVYSTGEKPEKVRAAFENMKLAQQEYETQKKITERNEILYHDNYISDEEYELSLNQYKIRYHRLNVAKSEYEAITTGAKPEQLEYIRSNIRMLEEQILQLNERLKSHSLLSPFSGVIIKRHEGGNNDSRESAIIRLADVSQYIVIVPVELYQLQYVEPGQNVSLTTNRGRQTLNAEIIAIDNSVQMINFRQKVFVTAAIENNENIHNVISNMIVEAEINCGMVPAREYINRLFRAVYQN